VYVGSESHPYAVKPTGTMLGSALGLGDNYMSADLEFACKAGTAAVQLGASQVEAGLVEAGLAVGADVSQAKPGDVLEFTAGAGAGALVLGASDKAKVRLMATMSISTDTPDFWRRAYQKYPSHAGRFTGEPGYFRLVVGAGKRFMEALELEPENIDHLVLHMPNGKFPAKAAKMLGFSQKQLEVGLGVAEIGNPYSGSSMVGLCKVLEVIKSREKLLVISYGSGAGSDCLLFHAK